jgi:hypothetical protein
MNICPCCKKGEIEGLGDYDICPVCGWEDDPVQRKDPDFEGGANDISLNQCVLAYSKGLYLNKAIIKQRNLEYTKEMKEDFTFRKVFMYADDFDASLYDCCSSYISSSVNDKNTLLLELARNLNFPAAFEPTWRDLYNYLCDLHWIPNNMILICHKNLPLHDEKDLKEYLTILANSVLAWRVFNEPKWRVFKRNLCILFSSSNKEYIESLLK